MDPIEIITQLFNASLLIYQQVEKAKANKTQFKRLAERIKIILEALKSLKQIPDSEHFRSGLMLLEEAVKETKTYLDQFVSQSWFKRVLKAGSDKEKFDSLNQTLERAMQHLNLGLDIHQVINRDEDREDQRRDTEELKAMQGEIIRLNQEELEAIQELHKASDQHAIIMKQQMASMRQQLKLLVMGDKHPLNLPVDRHLLVAFHEILVDRVIGEGSFGTVYCGRWQSQPVAIKTIQGITTSSDHEEFIREIQIMSRLRSRWITQFYGVCLDPTRQCLLMEYMEYGSLFSRLEHTPLTLEQQRSIALDVARGLLYLHSQGVVHGDLKSANVLLDKHHQAKLADFGLSHTRASSIMSLGKKSQAVQWMAPELFKRGSELTVEADRFSYGIVLWEIVTGRRPFQDFKDDVTQYVMQGGRETISPMVPEIYRDFIVRCWDEDPKKRPRLEEIIEALDSYHPRPSSPTAEEWFDQAQQHEKAKLYEQARASFFRAAQKNHTHAKTSYAFMLARGLGGPADKAQAYQWFERGAQEGHDRAQYNLGQMLEYADGARQDLNSALFWYQKAEAQGHQDATRRIARVREKLAEQTAEMGVRR